MNARSYRVNLRSSDLNFIANAGMTETTIAYITDSPVIVNDKVRLKIIKGIVHTDMFTNESHEVLKVQSSYEIPVNEIKTRNDVYEFYKDATISLNETYKALQRQRPTLPDRHFPFLPIENYQNEIDRVFSLIDGRN